MLSETVMLTSEGFIAEATADNIFVVSRSPGWEHDPGKITLTTPTSDYCLKGITRDLVLAHARALGFHVCESVTLVPEDLLGTGKEVFLTGTAAGIVPVVSLQGVQIGSGVPGPVTAKLHDLLEDDVKNGEKGLSMYASKADIDRYFAAAIY